MRGRIYQKFLYLLLVPLAGWILGGEASGLEVYTIGGAELSWKEAVWDETDPGAVVGGIDFEAQPGWIGVQQVDTTDNIALRTYERGGGVTVPNVRLSAEEKAKLEGMVNGDPTVALEMKSTPAKEVYVYGVLVQLDLGARFGVDRIRFFPRMSVDYPFQEDFLRGYAVYVNDGTEEATIEGRPIFQLVKREEKNSQSVVDVDLELQYVRYIRIKSLTRVNWEMDEIEVYGTGFLPEATYQSQVFDFGDLATLGKLWWSQRKIGDPELSEIIVRTRSGSDPTPLIYYRKLGREEEVEVSFGDYQKLKPEERGEIRYFTTAGDMVSRRDYEALSDEEKGEIEYYRVGGEVPLDEDGNLLTKASYEGLPPEGKGSIVLDRAHGWSGWSAPYPYEEVQNEGGVPIVSPAPRRYFQFRMDFENGDLRSSGRVDSLSFQFSKPPVAHQIVAEIAPQRVAPGVVTAFTYAAKADIRGEDTGFDRLEIVTPTKAEEVRSVRIDGQEVAFESLALEEDHFTIGFPRITGDQVLTVVFKGVVLRYGTLFEARAFDSQTGELKQSVIPGDATPDLPTNDLFVAINLGGSVIRSLEISPNPITPNGDGVHEVASIRYDLLKLDREMPLEVRVYDLSGYDVRTLRSERAESGVYSVTWDGEDEEGNLVPPGVYIVRVQIDTDSGVESRAKTVSVVY